MNKETKGEKQESRRRGEDREMEAAVKTKAEVQTDRQVKRKGVREKGRSGLTVYRERANSAPSRLARHLILRETLILSLIRVRDVPDVQVPTRGEDDPVVVRGDWVAVFLPAIDGWRVRVGEVATEESCGSLTHGGVLGLL